MKKSTFNIQPSVGVYALILLILITTHVMPAQNIIGGSTGDPSAVLDLRSNNKGLLLPRMSSEDRSAIANPAEGLLIYNTSLGCVEINLGSSSSPDWACMLALSGKIASLDCEGVVYDGQVTAGEEASGVSATIGYTGGSGGYYNMQSIPSTGVTGLTANLVGGVFAIGNGSLVFDITGTPSGFGTASFALNIGGKSCTLSLAVGPGSVSTQGVFFSETFTGSIPSSWINQVVQGNNQPSSSWVFSTIGPQGSFAIAPVASTTGGTGFVLFDSDLNCSHPTPQNVWLISPAINAADKQVVLLKFQTYYRSFSDRPQVRVGTNLNDLNSWASFEVFPGITANSFGGVLEGNASINPQLLTIDISEFAAGQSNVYIAFQFLSTSETNNGGNLIGCGYSWMVDDVILTDENP